MKKCQNKRRRDRETKDCQVVFFISKSNFQVLCLRLSAIQVLLVPSMVAPSRERARQGFGSQVVKKKKHTELKVSRRGHKILRHFFNQYIVLSFSDIVVQIVDARNPLLFRCEDLVRQCFVLFLQLHGFHHCAVQLLLLKCYQWWGNEKHKLQSFLTHSIINRRAIKTDTEEKWRNKIVKENLY